MDRAASAVAVAPAVAVAGVAVPIRSDVQAQELKAMKAKQEGFETVVKAELDGIKELLQRALEPKQPSPAAAATEVRVISALKGQPKQAPLEDRACDPSEMSS